MISYKTVKIGEIMKKGFTLAEGATHVGIFAKKRQVAFTIAEVLITLGIIGIVAAMTLSTVINNSRNKQLEVGLKRSYSVIAQAFEMYQAENGERITPQNTGLHELKPILMKYLKIVEDCGFGTSDTNDACIPNIDSGNFQGDKGSARAYKTFNGDAKIKISFFDDGQFVTNDGALILIENNTPNFNQMFISVDVNGYNKNPNRLGQDLFMFQIDKTGKLLPMGVKGSKYYSETEEYCSVSSSSNLNGAGCTYNALTDKDYFKNLPK